MEIIMHNSLSDDTLVHLKEVELMILKDFVEICEANDIEYYLIYGTQLGAVRHQGFIPWDDDIDVILFRDDYERFLKVMEDNPSDKYTIFDSRYNSEYFFQFGKMSLNDTYWSEYWDNQVSFKLGIYIDLFALDKLPDNKFKRWFHIQLCYYLTRMYSLSLLKFYNYSNLVNFVLNIIHSLLNVLHFTPSFFQKTLYKLYRKYDECESEYITDLSMKEKSYFKISDFKPAKKTKFEGHEFNIPNNDDNTMIPIYGDYMQLPKEEDRICHIVNKIDFGPY